MWSDVQYDLSLLTAELLPPAGPYDLMQSLCRWRTERPARGCAGACWWFRPERLRWSGVAVALIEAIDLGGQAVGDLETGCVVLGRIDSQAGRKALIAGVQAQSGITELALSINAADIRINV